MPFWREAEYPKDHRPGMRVPPGGSNCIKCHYHVPEGNLCKSFYFIKWNGSNRIPLPPDRYCSDWWEPKS